MENISFNELKKIAKKWEMKENTSKIALLGDCATQYLCVAIRGMCVKKRINADIWEADYDQIYAQIFNSESEMYAINPDYVILFFSSEKLLEQYETTDNTKRNCFVSEAMGNIEQCWKRLSQVQGLKIIQFQFVEIDDKVYGNYGNKIKNSFLYCLKTIQYQILEKACQYNNVYLMDLNSIQSDIGRNLFFDEKIYYLTKSTISFTALPLVADRTTDILRALQGNVVKCVICDLDNTLWGGTVAEDGMSGIQIGELGTGRAFTDLQRWLKLLKERGILLAVCSKNDQNTVLKVFRENSDMILKENDFAVFVANYEDKAANIKYIQSVLNIGYDSMVFLDDSCFERNLVRTLIPDIMVPELPEDPALYLKYLKDLNLFESASSSEEDVERTEQYRRESKRKELQRQFASYQEYLKNLNMEVTNSSFDPFHFPRIAQLTQRSNQFNLRTIRYTEAEIKKISQNRDYITQYYELRDKFGDHGLTGIVILKKIDRDALFIDTFLMSCRVLKRGMEEYIMNHIIQIAKKNNCIKVIGEYIPTVKNGIVKNFYNDMGLRIHNKNQWIINVNEYKNKTTEIKEKAQ